MGNLVIVSNRLPISVKKVDGRLEFYQSLGGIATGLANYTKRPGTRWVGWPGLPSDGLSEAEKQQITKELSKHRYYPIFLTQQQIDDYYTGYSNGVLWPLFHDLPITSYPKTQWEAYREVNQLFADETLRLSTPGSTVWIHDYQLLLVPELLRRSGRQDKIGLFQHIPFPTEDKLRQLPELKNLLEGMLGGDLVGFHTRGYARNFLETCDIVLETGRHQDFVQLGNRTVRVAEFPMGIDYNRFTKAIQQQHDPQALRLLRGKYRGRKVILTVDRLDPTKGLLERVRAYRQLLKQNPKLRGTVVMAMIVAPSRTDIPEYQELERQLDELVTDINKKYGKGDWVPVDYMYESFPLETVMLYYQVADVAFIAPLRDGMNLVAKEYLASKQNNGVLVLSKTAGAAEELRDAIQVDPVKPRSLVHGLKRALNLPKQELQARAARMHEHIEQFTVQRWATNFIDTLQLPLRIRPARTKTLTDSRANTLITAYHKARKRLLLLDYDGVLREFVKDPMAAKPTPEVMRLLRRLGQNPDNELVIVSGRSKKNLDDWFGKLGIALAAEHGAFFRRSGGKNWHKTGRTDIAWHKPVRDLFTYYAEATPGASVEQKRTSIVWHYRAATPFLAQKNLVAIRRLLRPLLRYYGLVAKDGNKVLEVHPNDINKGRIAQEWLIHDHDFVLAMGDDVTDEDMFVAVPAGAYSIKVGRKQTAARFRVKNVAEAVAFLSKL